MRAPRTALTAALVGLVIGAGVAVSAPRMGTFRPPIAQIQDNGTLKPYEPALNLSGTGVSCVDDGANMRTTCTITSSGGDAGPLDATYITQTPNASLTSEQALSLNTTGVMISTTGTGVVSTYAGTSCTNQFPRSLDSSAVATCATVSLSTDVTGTLPTGNGGTSTLTGSVFKAARVSSTVNVASLSGLLTVDGVTVASGDRVLVKNQTTASANGVYVAAAGAWSFAADWSTGAVVPMQVVDVAEGTQNQHSTWVLNTTGTITVGTTSLSFGPLNTNFPSRWPLGGSTVRVSASDPNADFQTIQSAIDATGPAPVVILVAPGTYAESLTLTATRQVKLLGVYSTGVGITGASIAVTRTTTSADIALVTLTSDSTSAPKIDIENISFTLNNTAPSAPANVNVFRTVESGLASDQTASISLKNVSAAVTESNVAASHVVSVIKSGLTSRLSTAVTLRDVALSVTAASVTTDVTIWAMLGSTSLRRDTLTVYGSNTFDLAASGSTKSLIQITNSNCFWFNYGQTRFSANNATTVPFIAVTGFLTNYSVDGFARVFGVLNPLFDSVQNVQNLNNVPALNLAGEYKSFTPPAPIEGTSVFSRTRAGRRSTAQVTPAGRWDEFQAGFYGTKIGLWNALGNSTTVNSLGIAENATGTATARNVATTNMSTSMRRIAYVSSAVAGNSAGTRHNIAQWWFGNAATLGGFFYSTRFIISQTSANFRWFVGLSNTTAALANANPSTLLNLIGFSIDSTQTTIRFINNDGAGAATATDLGASFPANTTTAVYEARIFVAPNTTVVNYSLERLDSAQFVEGSVNSNIPTSTTFLSPQLWVNNGTDATAVAVDVVSQYIETDF